MPKSIFRIVTSIITAIILSFLGVGIAMLHFTDMSILFLVLTKIGITLQSVVFLSPLALFLIVYGDVTIQLIVWCGCIKDDAVLNQKDPTSNMKNLRQFLKASVTNFTNLQK